MITIIIVVYGSVSKTNKSKNFNKIEAEEMKFSKKCQRVYQISYKI
jgi:hypothetical protein